MLKNLIRWPGLVLLLFLASCATDVPRAHDVLPVDAAPIEHPMFGLKGNIAFPCLARRASDNAVFLVFAYEPGKTWDYICITSSRDGGKTWNPAVKVMQRPGNGYIADPTVVVTDHEVNVIATFVSRDSNNKKFAHSEFLESTSADGISGWSTPVNIGLARKYVSGKVEPPIWTGHQEVLMGYSYDLPAEFGKPVAMEKDMVARAGVLLSRDGGETWRPAGEAGVDIRPVGADEPAIVKLSTGALLMVIRTAAAHPYETHSYDGGFSWDFPLPSALTTHNAPTCLLRLNDGRILRAWDNSAVRRSPLVLAISADDGHTWSQPRNVAVETPTPGGKSLFNACYPSLAQAEDGSIVMTWWESNGKASRLGLARVNVAWVLKSQTDTAGGLR